MSTEQTTARRNNSKLAYADCMLILSDKSRAFEGMETDDLDSIYAAAFGRWAYHMTREGYIKALNEKRSTMKQY